MTGWIYYKKNQSPFVKASNEVYFDKILILSYVNNLCHAWMSMEGQAEAYNQTWLNSKEVYLINVFLDKNPGIGKHFDQKINSANADEELQFEVNDNCNEGESLKAGKNIFTGMADMHRKSLTQVYHDFNFLSLYLETIIFRHFQLSDL